MTEEEASVSNKKDTNSVNLFNNELQSRISKDSIYINKGQNSTEDQCVVNSVNLIDDIQAKSSRDLNSTSNGQTNTDDQGIVNSVSPFNELHSKPSKDLIPINKVQTDTEDQSIVNTTSNTGETITSYESIRSIVRSPSSNSLYQSNRICCFKWLRFNPFRQRPREITATEPLLPVHNLPYTPIITSSQYSRIIFDFIEKWIISLSRRNYSSTIIWIFATILTLALIATTLGLYFTGNIKILVQLAKALVCQIISQFSSDSLPSFC